MLLFFVVFSFFSRSFSSLYTNHHTFLQLFQLSYESVYVQMFRKSSVFLSLFFFFSFFSFFFFFPFLFLQFFPRSFSSLYTNHHTFLPLFLLSYTWVYVQMFEKTKTKKLPLERARRAPELQAVCQQALRFFVFCFQCIVLLYHKHSNPMNWLRPVQELTNS